MPFRLLTLAETFPQESHPSKVRSRVKRPPRGISHRREHLPPVGSEQGDGCSFLTYDRDPFELRSAVYAEPLSLLLP